MKWIALRMSFDDIEKKNKLIVYFLSVKLHAFLAYKKKEPIFCL